MARISDTIENFIKEMLNEERERRIESGEYKILIGASSQDIRLEHSFLVADKHCYTISDANAWTYIAGE